MDTDQTRNQGKFVSKNFLTSANSCKKKRSIISSVFIDSLLKCNDLDESFKLVLASWQTQLPPNHPEHFKIYMNNMFGHTNGFIFVYIEHKNKYLYLRTRGVSHWVVVKRVICTHAGKDFGRDLAPSKWNKGVLRAVSLENGHLLNVVWLFDLQKKSVHLLYIIVQPKQMKKCTRQCCQCFKYWSKACEILILKLQNKMNEDWSLQKINIFIKRFKIWATVSSIAFKSTNQILSLHLE